MIEKVTIKYDGAHYERNVQDLDIGNPDNPTDNDLRNAMVVVLRNETGDQPDLSDFVVDRFESVANIRPSATYGSPIELDPGPLPEPLNPPPQNTLRRFWPWECIPMPPLLEEIVDAIQIRTTRRRPLETLSDHCDCQREKDKGPKSTD